jgi:hypothetical protein
MFYGNLVGYINTIVCCYKCINIKKLILEKTLKLMIKKQNSLVSVREISTATGIGAGGICHYFYFTHQSR